MVSLSMGNGGSLPVPTLSRQLFQSESDFLSLRQLGEKSKLENIKAIVNQLVE
jgi:hypothetical protein